MQPITLKWIEAGKLIAKNPDEKVKCPQCGSADLTVTDYHLDNNSSEMSRYMQCPLCKAQNILKLRR